LTKLRTNTRKIFNDPIYGFISIPYEIIFHLIEHPYFQRLRRISQLGLSNLVYPGALHTRFHHALGAMHLMGDAIEIIRSKGHEITEDEAQGVTIAILLHDIGHGPFSHALENTIVKKVHHEDLSLLIMKRLNESFEGKLSLAIEIFTNTYHKKFLHQLVSSQLDMDRLDYLKRDSFYTGVSEGVIGSDRIIKMLEVVNDELVIEDKGIYSIEKFLIARRLMYWQVYLHKAVVSAEFMLVNILRRAKELTEQGTQLFASPPLITFLKNTYGLEDFLADKTILDQFTQLDDFDIFGAIKVWCHHSDTVLSQLCLAIVNRTLFKTQISELETDGVSKKKLITLAANHYKISEQEATYFVINVPMSNNAYSLKNESINILEKNGNIKDVSKASDNLNISALSRPVTKFFLCLPKEVFKQAVNGVL
jgi:HD superfamily phosphohydrolase